jgi:hypothetical protein
MPVVASRGVLRPPSTWKQHSETVEPGMGAMPRIARECLLPGSLVIHTKEKELFLLYDLQLKDDPHTTK